MMKGKRVFCREREKESASLDKPTDPFCLFIDDHVISILNHLFAVDELNEQLIAHVLNYRSLCLSLVWVKQGTETADNAFQILKVYHSLFSLLAKRDGVNVEVCVI